MNLDEAFATYLQNTLSLATIGQNLFIGQSPSSNKVPDSIWLVTASGGAKERKLKTGDYMSSYQVEVRYRHRDYKTVYDALNSLETQLNSDPCTQLTDFDTVEIEATTYPIDNDLDSEDRKIGLLVAQVTTLKETP